MAKVFFSYSHKDEPLREELERHLVTLQRQGIIETWHDRKILAGDDVDGRISEHLEQAEIVLILVSSDFLSSRYCYDVELKRALERHHSGVARVIPVILRPCDWRDTSFGNLLATPTDGKPITRWADRDEALLNVAVAIRHAVQTITRPGASLALLEDSSRPAGQLAGRIQPASVRDVDLCGRSEEIERISTLLKAVAGGKRDSSLADFGVHFMLIGGESGAGKSSLAWKACHLATEIGFDVVAVGCELFHEGMSLFPMREVVRQLNPGATILESIINLYGPSSPQAVVAELAGNNAADASQRRDALIATFVNIMLGRFHFARERGEQAVPLLIFIDDLECIDAGTADALLCLMSRRQEGQIVIVGAYRTDLVRAATNSSHPLIPILSAVKRHGPDNIALTIRAIGRAQLPQMTETLLGGKCDLSAAFYSRLFNETEGNPLFVRELLRVLTAPPSDNGGAFLVKRDDVWKLARPIDQWRIPATVEEAIKTRMALLDDRQRSELEKAAIIGSRFAFQVMLRLSSASEDDLLEMLESFISFDIIREVHESGEVFVFSHGKIREVLYQNMSTLRRRRTHENVAQVLLDLEGALGDDWGAMIAEHLFQAQKYAEACPRLIRAARSSMRMFAAADAARQYEKALTAGEKGCFPTEESLIRIELEEAEALKAAHDYDAAAARFNRLRSLDDRLVSGRAVNHLGDIHLVRGDVARAYDCYHEAEQISRETGDADLLVETVADLTELYNREAEHLAGTDPDKSRQMNERYNAYLDEEIALAAQSDRQDVKGRAFRNAAKRLRTQGRVNESLEFYERALKTEPAGSASHRILVPYAKTLRLVGEHERALEIIDKVLVWSRQVAALRSEAIARQYRGLLLWEQAALARDSDSEKKANLMAESVRELNLALTLHSEVGYKNGKRETLISLGEWYFSSGDETRGLECFSAAVGSNLDKFALLQAISAELRSNGESNRASNIEALG